MTSIPDNFERFQMKIRCKLGKSRRFPKPTAPLPKPPSRRARQLALAYAIDRAIESGELRDYADAARRLGVSRARISQIVGLLGMLVWEQEAVLGEIARSS